MDAVEEIKNRLSIEEVIGEYVELKRAGRNWRGLSPFTSEKTPSFMVSSEKQIWHDFSSGKGGNMFSFVMEMDGLEFKGALELLARKAGVDLEQYNRGYSKENTRLKERLYEANELATKFYQVQFSKNRTAYTYILKTRKYTKETALEWRIGYSPQNGKALADFLRSKGFSVNEMKQAGLVTQRQREPYDMFRGRIMIPLADPQGRVIGFTARLLEDDPEAPKYINTPQTALYNKSRHVFGLHLAKEAIHRNHYVVIAEGNLDVITSHQAGVRQVVATAGTALTEQQLKALSRFTDDIRLCFDADSAGVAATERSIPIASKVGVNLSIVPLPSGKDPDELIKQDTATWQKIIEEPHYALDWLIERYQKQLDIRSALGKKQFSDIILRVISGLGDPVEREHYLGVVADTLGVSTEALQAKLGGQKSTTLKHPRRDVKLTDRDRTEAIKVQDHFLSLVFRQPRLRDFLKSLRSDMFFTDQAKHFLQFLKSNLNFAGTEEAEELKNFSEYAKILVLQYEELYGNLDFIELRYEAARLQARVIEQYVKTQKLKIAEQLHTADDTVTHALLGQAKQLDSLLKQAKEA